MYKKLISRGFRKFQEKEELPPVGIDLTTLAITGLEIWCSSNKMSYDALTVSDCETRIEYRNDPSPKHEMVHETKFSLRIFYSKHVWVAEWNRHLTSNPLMMLVLWVQFPLGATSVLAKTFSKSLDVNFVQKCRICVVNENLEWLRCYIHESDLCHIIDIRYGLY